MTERATRGFAADQRLVQLARRQNGVFHRSQARRAGMSDRQIQARLSVGAWAVVHPGVYRAASTAGHHSTRAMAALLHAGPGALISHVSAARLLGVDVPRRTGDVWVTVPAERRPARRPGVVVVRTRNMPHALMVSGFPATPVARTAVDLAQILDVRPLQAVFHDLMRRGLLLTEEILALAESMRGKAGLARLRQALDDFDPASESVLEADAGRLFLAAGLELEQQVEIHDGPWLVARLDFADRKRKIAIEIDGLSFHSGYGALTHDRRRDRSLQRMGWTVLRFTADDIRLRSDRMIDEIRAQIAHIDRRGRK